MSDVEVLCLQTLAFDLHVLPTGRGDKEGREKEVVSVVNS